MSLQTMSAITNGFSKMTRSITNLVLKQSTIGGARNVTQRAGWSLEITTTMYKLVAFEKNNLPIDGKFDNVEEIASGNTLYKLWNEMVEMSATNISKLGAFRLTSDWTRQVLWRALCKAKWPFVLMHTVNLGNNRTRFYYAVNMERDTSALQTSRWIDECILEKLEKILTETTT
jgi:hypothetical protein